MKLFDRSTKAGFTLVELIVVIAILAILAGIAIPVYSGYIKKANKAGDLVLLDAANTAFAAACYENGVISSQVSGANLVITSNCITGVSGVTWPATAQLSAKANSGVVIGNLGGSVSPSVRYAPLAATSDDISASFVNYFGANKDVPLKYFESASDFTFSNGVFVPDEDAGNGNAVTYSVTKDTAAGTVSVTSSDGTINFTVSEEDYNNVLASTFGDSSKITMGDLMGEVDSVTDFATTFLGNEDSTANALIEGILGSADFASYATTKFGDDPFTDYLSRLYRRDEETGLYYDENDEIVNTSDLQMKAMMNALVMYTASNSSGIDTAGVNSQIINGTFKNSVKNMINSEGEFKDSMTELAYAYAMGTAYLYSTTEADANGNKNINSSDIMNLFISNSIDEGFATYLGSAAAQKDAVAYESSMSMIDQNIGNLDASSILFNGYADEQLIDALSALFG